MEYVFLTFSKKKKCMIYLSDVAAAEAYAA